MKEPQAFVNGRFVRATEVAVPVYDAGFLQGTTVAEQLRTFGGRLFELEPHLERLFRSLSIIGVDPGIAADQLAEAAERVALYNHGLLEPGDDLGVTVFATPGPYAAIAPPGDHGAMVCIHTFPLAFRLWASKYEAGEALATTDVAQVSARSWPPELKCRSRMHYFLADRQARARSEGARALMLDSDGYVTEATTANVLVYFEGEGLVTPPRAKVLPGISLAVLARLADEQSIPLKERDLAPAELLQADEVLLTSTSPCILPVVRFNNQPVGSGTPGPVQRRLLTAWSQLVEIDIPQQAKRFAARK